MTTKALFEQINLLIANNKVEQAIEKLDEFTKAMPFNKHIILLKRKLKQNKNEWLNEDITKEVHDIKLNKIGKQAMNIAELIKAGKVDFPVPAIVVETKEKAVIKEKNKKKTLFWWIKLVFGLGVVAVIGLTLYLSFGSTKMVSVPEEITVKGYIYINNKLESGVLVTVIPKQKLEITKDGYFKITFKTTEQYRDCKLKIKYNEIDTIIDLDRINFENVNVKLSTKPVKKSKKISSNKQSITNNNEPKKYIPNTCTVSGYVKNNETKEAVVGAIVMINNNKKLQTKTGIGGSFSIEVSKEWASMPRHIYAEKGELNGKVYKTMCSENDVIIRIK